MKSDIRKLEKADEPAVCELITSIMQTEFADDEHAFATDDLNDILAHYGGDRELFLVAERDGRIVGTVGIKEDGSDVALLRRIFVEKDLRGKGYGTKLLSAAMIFCYDSGYHTLVFRGTDRMQPAIRLLIRNGFEQSDLSELGDRQLVVLTKDI